MRVKKFKTRNLKQCGLCDLLIDNGCTAEFGEYKFPDDDDRCWDNIGGRYYFKFIKKNINTTVI
jgi:hypothetical protein